MSFATNLRKYREQAGFKSAKEFADFINLPYTTYINYEKENNSREPRFNIVSKIADALNISTDQLIGFEKPEDKTQRYRQKLQNLGFSVLFQDVNSGYNVLIENRDGLISEFSSQDFMDLMKKIESSKELANIEYAVYNNAFEEYKNEKYKNVGKKLLDWIAANNFKETEIFKELIKCKTPDLFKEIINIKEIDESSHKGK